jgi:DNA-binding PadR family transcriptional regulator
MRSPIGWALLGLVIQRASYGYELVQRFERTYGADLSLSSPSQIYTSLDTLARNTLIEEISAAERPPEPGRQPKPHYRATARGVCNYREWLVAQLHDERRRSRLFAHQLAVLPPREALTVIERFERVCLDQAAIGPAKSARERDGDSLGGLVERLVSEEARLSTDAQLAWVEYARREFSALTDDRTSGR